MLLYLVSMCVMSSLLYIGKLKGVMRVGSFARSLMLRGECSVDLVLMCTGMHDWS